MVLAVSGYMYTQILVAFAMAWCTLCMYLERIVHMVRQMWPDMVLDMHYVDPAARAVVPLYAPMFPMFASWSTHFAFEFKHKPACTGVYVFRVWQKKDACYATYAVSPAHFMAALQIKSVMDAWMFSECAIVACLSSYVETHKEALDIMDITVDGKPALSELKPVIKSMCLPLNLRACTLAPWRAFVRSERRLWTPVWEEATVTIVDGDLNETTYVGEEVVCAYKKNE